MLSIKGNTIIKDISLLNSLINIKPKDINIKIYSIDHTGPNRYEGGDHLGFFNFEYHCLVSICSEESKSDSLYYH